MTVATLERVSAYAGALVSLSRRIPTSCDTAR